MAYRSANFTKNQYARSTCTDARGQTPIIKAEFGIKELTTIKMEDYPFMMEATTHKTYHMKTLFMLSQSNFIHRPTVVGPLSHVDPILFDTLLSRPITNQRDRRLEYDEDEDEY